MEHAEHVLQIQLEKPFGSPSLFVFSLIMKIGVYLESVVRARAGAATSTHGAPNIRASRSSHNNTKQLSEATFVGPQTLCGHTLGFCREE